MPGMIARHDDPGVVCIFRDAPCARDMIRFAIDGGAVDLADGWPQPCGKNSAPQDHEDGRRVCRCLNTKIANRKPTRICDTPAISSLNWSQGELLHHENTAPPRRSDRPETDAISNPANTRGPPMPAR